MLSGRWVRHRSRLLFNSRARFVDSIAAAIAETASQPQKPPTAPQKNALQNVASTSIPPVIVWLQQCDCVCGGTFRACNHECAHNREKAAHELNG